MPTPTYFPQILTTGATTQMPYKHQKGFHTDKNTMDNGLQYSYPWFGAGLTYLPTGPLFKWEVNLSSISDAERSALKTWWRSMVASRGLFTYLDPDGNLVGHSDNMQHASWTLSNCSVTSTAQVDPYGGHLAQTLTASGSNALLYTTVLPDGGASGFWLTASVYAKAAGAGQSLAIGFIDSGFSVLGNQTYALPAGLWTRIDFTIHLATASYIRVLIGGSGSWNSGAVTLFGAQCCAMPGPGQYVRTPGRAGLIYPCRFDQDRLDMKYLEPNSTSAVLRIRQINLNP